MVIDFGSLVEEEDQGAALQALVAEQLKESPSSMFFIANIEYLDASGAAVLLALIGTPLLSFFLMLSHLREEHSLSPCVVYVYLSSNPLYSCLVGACDHLLLHKRKSRNR